MAQDQGPQQIPGIGGKGPQGARRAELKGSEKVWLMVLNYPQRLHPAVHREEAGWGTEGLPS